MAFLTVQAAQHVGRRSGYVNAVLSVRVGSAVGSCAVEPGEIDDEVVREIVGADLAELLRHPVTAVRVAALDACLGDAVPHARHPRARSVRVPAGTSLEKSTARARAVAELVEVPAGGRVAVVGVVNSLLAALRERGIDYVPCDLKGGVTEWEEPVLTDHQRAIDGADAVLASGMVLGNGTFDSIAALCRSRELPLVMFAQSGSAVFREMLGEEITGLSAEPYPFFWLSGGDTDVHLYRGGLG
ncbi:MULTISPECIES: Rossmann-like domain-containing protein [Saccharopolyspora]|uniref:Rossmann-like domain-containing protein n=1 Tax=Saccharopolyspora TaxID=1835 RepID=UPI001FE30B84|nr:DUF364 domain-containing protein [Saccharopolyspora flava]